ncbi:MAG: CD1247 N-terminal domain-containing protein [Christensenellales bacterium]|jgi:DNA-directed RNA polymerase subunit delta
MGYLKEQVSYIRGMADGLSMDSSTKEGKLILAMISLLNEIADAVESNEVSVDELTESIEKIKDDVDCLESQIYGEELDDLSPWCEEDEEEDEDPNFVEMVCPQCKDTIFFDVALVNGKDALTCPSCEAPLREKEE